LANQPEPNGHHDPGRPEAVYGLAEVVRVNGESSLEVAAAAAGYWERRDRQLSASHAVHDTIREMILSGVLAPGTRLGEEDFAKYFAVSRTPVREALLRLQTERLVGRSQGRSLMVASVTTDEILEIYVVRQAVDGLAARLAAESARGQDVATLRWLNQRLSEAAAAGDPEMMVVINLQFHEAVCQAGRNDFLLSLMVTVHDRARRFPGTTFSRVGRPAAAVAEHEAMILAIEERRIDDAERLARQHMANAMEVRIQLLRNEATSVSAATVSD
jgi:DNA-binding GntR family transcriptional regulator